MRDYRHVMLDFDGVLCDSLGTAIDVFNRLREEEFPALPEVGGRDDMVRVYGGSLRTCLAAWLEEDEQRRFFDLHSAAMAERAEDLRPFDGVGTMLRSLPPDSVSLVTSAYAQAATRILTAEGGTIPGAVHEIAGREQRLSKTEKLGRLARGLGLQPEDCLYVGDLESDVLYCRAVPMDIAVVTYGYHPRWHLEQLRPAHLVDSVEQLSALIHEALAQGSSLAR